MSSPAIPDKFKADFALMRINKGMVRYEFSQQVDAMNRPPTPQVRRSFGVLLVFVPILGLATRRYAASLPGLWADYAPDALWALLVFVLVVLLARRLTLGGAALVALGFSYAIEVSQLYQAPWINAIRHTRLGGLVLGFGFLWSDLVCYTVGIACGVGLAWALQREEQNHAKR